MTVSNTFSVSVNNPPVPAWFGSLAHKQWATPLNNATSIAANRHWLGASNVIDPGYGLGYLGSATGRLSEWTGMGADQSRKWIFMLHNGGHNSSFGNEVYSCDLTQETPMWTRRRNATVPSGSGNLTKWSDGRPVSDHTVNLTIEAEGRWFTPGMSSTNYSGFQNYQQWWEYSPVTDDYIDLGATHPSPSPGDAVGSMACWDPLHRQIIVQLPNNSTGPGVIYQSIDNMSGAAALVRNQSLPSTTASGGVDTTNRVLMLRMNGIYYCWSLASNATKQAAPVQLSASGTQANTTQQMYWHPASNAWITWDFGTGNLKKLTPTVSGGNYTALAWSASIAGAGGNSPSGASGLLSLMYNKVNFIQDMGDGTSALVVVPRHASPDVYVCRLTGAI